MCQAGRRNDSANERNCGALAPMCFQIDLQDAEMTHPRIHAASAPEKPAVLMSDSSAMLTYGELEDRANQGAHVLRAKGFARGDSVAFWLPNGTGVFEF